LKATDLAARPVPATHQPDPPAWWERDGATPPVGTAHLAWLVAALALAVAGPAARHVANDQSSRAFIVGGAALVWLVAAELLPSRRWTPGVDLVLAAGLVAASPTGAHRATAVALSALAIGRWALAGPGGRPVAALVVPLLAAAEIAWYRQASSAVVAGLLLAGALVLAAASRWPTSLRRAAGWVSSAFRAVGAALAAAVLFAAALPLLYIPGVAARYLARRRRRGVRSTWERRALPAGSEHHLARRPFAPTPARDRRRRNGIGIALLVVAGLGLAVADRVRPVHTERQLAAPRAVPPPEDRHFKERAEVVFSHLPAFAGVPFADALQHEQQQFAEHLAPDSTTAIASGTFHGRYTNVVDGERVTARTDCSGCPAVTMWLVGGSTAFGLGQRDDHTIASDLVRLAAADHVALTVHNFAVPGWTLWQESQAVMDRLGRPGARLPDLIVSYGGFNDVSGAGVMAAADGLGSGTHNVLETATIQKFVKEHRTLADAGGAVAVSRQAADRYREVQDQMIALARSRDIATAFFFQPDAMASPTQLRPVKQIFTGLPPSVAGELGTILERTSNLLEPSVVDLRHLYDEERTSLYADWAHTNERGARLAAAAMYRTLGPAIRGDAHP
jgi:hypothetical protein